LGSYFVKEISSIFFEENQLDVKEIEQRENFRGVQNSS
jgi:hypothetical protein